MQIAHEILKKQLDRTREEIERREEKAASYNLLLTQESDRLHHLHATERSLSQAVELLFNHIHAGES